MNGQLNGFDRDISTVSVHELYARVTILRRMIENEKMCRRYMVMTNSGNWGGIQHSTFAKLQNQCRLAIGNIKIELQSREGVLDANGCA